jgi:hypothetical protein
MASGDVDIATGSRSFCHKWMLRTIAAPAFQHKRRALVPLPNSEIIEASGLC